MANLSKIKIIFTATSLLILSSKDAQAYLDPGTGSFIFQIIIAGAVGGIFAVKSYWSKLVRVIKKIIGVKRSENSEHEKTS